jgi:hypothetical protein
MPRAVQVARAEAVRAGNVAARRAAHTECFNAANVRPFDDAAAAHCLVVADQMVAHAADLEEHASVLEERTANFRANIDHQRTIVDRAAAEAASRAETAKGHNSTARASAIGDSDLPHASDAAIEASVRDREIAVAATTTAAKAVDKANELRSSFDRAIRELAVADRARADADAARMDADAAVAAATAARDRIANAMEDGELVDHRHRAELVQPDAPGVVNTAGTLFHFLIRKVYIWQIDFFDFSFFFFFFPQPLPLPSSSLQGRSSSNSVF